jgi:hypothetical protein
MNTQRIILLVYFCVCLQLQQLSARAAPDISGSDWCSNYVLLVALASCHNEQCHHGVYRYHFFTVL